MKLFEIGNGLKSIKMSGNYCSDWENADTVFLYDPELDDIIVRVSVISVESKDPSEANPAYKSVINNGEEDGHQVITIDHKSYYTYNQESEHEGEMIRNFFFEVGYKCHFILITVTVSENLAGDESTEKVLNEIEEAIATIEEISLEKTNIFEPKYTDFKGINERVAAILKVDEEQIDTCHENGNSLAMIQKILDNKIYSADNTYELQSLGIALGDYIQYTHGDYHWAIARDQYGRDLCLQYKNLAMTVFPMTMISKRVEDGEEFLVDNLVQGLLDKVEEVAQEGGFAELDYNYE